jgi:hypothetical protein
MDIIERLAQWAENDMKAEAIALEAKNEIELLRKQFELSRDLGMQWMDEIERLREDLRLERQLRDDALRAFNEARVALKEGK